ncbi:MAG TPA: hypothetical protein VLL54_06275 [Pyrinomonadaceae bacterium]|nr:hypothetical protein [Pyrinomonadaceae bacterium]
MALATMSIYKANAKSIMILVVAMIITAGVAFACSSHSVKTAPSVLYPEAPSVEAESTKGPKTCAQVEVSSLDITTEYPRPDMPFNAAPSTTVTPEANSKEVMIVALGPALGSMDSFKLKTQLTCTAKGFAVAATVIRSADYQGGVVKNVLWRPRIKIAAKLREPEATFEMTWKMRLTSGLEVEHADTPPYASQKYPITLSNVIR